MKNPHKFSLALRIIAWIIAIWMGATTAVLAVGGIYELRQGSDGPEILVMSVVFLGITAVFGWLATGRKT